jgi:lactate racemase
LCREARLLTTLSMQGSSLPSSLAALVSRGALLVRPRTCDEMGSSAVPDVRTACREALSRPVGCAPLGALAKNATRVVLIVSDATRDEPRVEMLDVLREELDSLDDDRISIVIASGTHAPRPPETVLPERLLSRHRVLAHDGSDPGAVEDLGTTTRGTRVRIARELATADVVVSTGRIRPHYFAGYSGGAKGIFPGCALSIDARQNHLWKANASARLGRLDDNECRLDMEEAARRLPGVSFVLNVVADCDGRYVRAFAGDLVLSHRAACEAAAPFFVGTVPRRVRVVVTSDLPPVTDSLYQASKLLPPAGAALSRGGTAIVVAPCPEGIGPLSVVNEGIYALGVRHHLPEGHRVLLVSDLPEATVSESYATHAPDLDAALRAAGVDPDGRLDEVAVLWRAGELVITGTPGTG